jgi:hypothetical protein
VTTESVERSGWTGDGLKLYFCSKDVKNINMDALATGAPIQTRRPVTIKKKRC